MKVFETIKEVKAHIAGLKKTGKSIGFVPTMGALHRGHIELIKQARQNNDVVAVSVFVNPKQFNNPEDLKKYPRDLEKDLGIISEIGCDVVFAPSTEEMYPGPVAENYYFGDLEETMEGKYRKGHFKGVAIVVKRLFDIIEPDKAYFGKKDYQQLMVVKKLVEKTGLPVEIVPCETVREPDGLAMSSRNKRLTPQQRKEAPIIYKSLIKASRLYPNTPIEQIKQIITYDINSMPSLQLEYFEIVDSENLKPITSKKAGQKPIACIAVYAGDIRLIDNMIFND